MTSLQKTLVDVKSSTYIDFGVESNEKDPKLE